MKDVVTSIIKNGDRILILKRSQAVGSCRGRWAGVSGYIEEYDESAIERAMKEIEEETGLTKDEIKFLKEAEPIDVVDGNTVWRVHPFLFETNKNSIKIDWEHVEYRWILPEEIKNYDTVPMLDKVIFSLLNKE